MRQYSVHKVAVHRGSPRIFVEGLRLNSAGFAPGVSFTVEVDTENHRVSLRVDSLGTNTVSRRKVGSRERAVIDLNNKKSLSVFDGHDAVRMVVTNNTVRFLPLASRLAEQERLERLNEKLALGTPLTTAAICSGAGLMANALEAGYRAGGLNTAPAIVNEIDEEFVEIATERNCAVPVDALALVAPIQELVQDVWLMSRLPRVEIVELSLPCSGASSAGKAKRGLAVMEEHPEVGHLAAAALMLLQKLQPAIVIAENVPGYQNTGSAWMMRHTLRDMGYVVHETELHGKDFGVLEDRHRWFMVAATRGITVDISQLHPALVSLPSVADVIDQTIHSDDPRWTAFSYLKTKEVRDLAKGNGFMMQSIRPCDSSVPTLRKGHHKGGSTDPLLKHPTDDALLRKFTAQEHAAIKGFPPSLVHELSETAAHQILGQSVLFKPVFALGKRIAECLLKPEQPLQNALQTSRYSLARATG